MLLGNFPSIKKILYLLILLPVVWVVGLFVFIHNIPEKQEVPSGTVDAIVVLTGGKNRIEEGVRLFLAVKAKKLLISGVPDGVTIGDILKNLKDTGVITLIHSDDIILGNLAQTTITNSMETRIFMNLHNYKSMALVTSNYHIIRSTKIFSNDMPDIKIYPCPVVAERFRKSGSFISWPSMQLAITEYNKLLLFYLLKLDRIISDFGAWYQTVWQSMALRFLDL